MAETQYLVTISIKFINVSSNTTPLDAIILNMDLALRRRNFIKEQQVGFETSIKTQYADISISDPQLNHAFSIA